MAAPDEVLRGAHLFVGLPPDVVDELLPRFRTQHYQRGAHVFEEEEPGDSLYVVLDGRISLTTSDGDQSTLVAILDPGDMFGELSLFDPGPRTTTATVVGQAATLAVVGRPDVLRWSESHPEVSSRLLRVLARRLRRSNSALRDLVFVDVPGRVAGVLLDLGIRYGRPDGDGIVVEHGLTQAQLAQMVGASRETVNKALSEFVGRGWLTQPTSGRIDLHEVSSLRRRAGRAHTAHF